MIHDLIVRSMRVAFLAMGALALASCSSSSSSDSSRATSLAITATSPSVAKGTSTQLTVTAIYGDNSHADVTSDLDWTSSNPAVATVDSSGKVSTLSTGTNTITVTCAVPSSCGSLSASFIVTVTPATVVSIALTPPIPNVAAGTTQTFIATGKFTDNTTQDLSADLTWTSSNTAIANVSAGGLVSTMSAGSVVITAACRVASVCSTVSGSATLTVTSATIVSIAVTPSAPSLAVGTSQQLIATGTFSDHTTQNLSADLAWTSSSPAVATVSVGGLVGALASGSVTIAATCTVTPVCGSLAGTTRVTVTAATLVSIAITPSVASVALGSNESFTATGTYTDNSTQNLTSQVTWMSATVGVATISNASGSAGVAHSVTAGTTQITAALGGITSPAITFTVTPATLVSIAITPTTASIAVAATQHFVAKGTYSDASTQDLTTTVTWGSSDTSVADVSNASTFQGLATGLMAGSSSISATSGAVSATAIMLTVTAQPVVTVLYSFTGGTDGQIPYAGLTQGTDGNFYGTTVAGGVNGLGTVFRLTPAGVETVLWSFGSGTDGAEPYAGLIQGTDGNFYGTTYFGGNNNGGAIFKITPSGAETVLLSLDSAVNGQNPVGTLIQGADGNFYGTTNGGGTNGGGTVFDITPAGVGTVLWSFNTGNDAQSPYAALIQGSDGNFYGTTPDGGASGNGTVFKVTPAGAETVLYSFSGGTDGKTPIGGLIQGADGNFYGTTLDGGTNGHGTIYKITPAGAETVLYSFGNGTDGQDPEAGLTQGADGNFYGTTYGGGTYGGGTLFAFTPTGDEITLWSFGGIGDGTQPFGTLIQGADGHFYGTTYNGGTSGYGTVFKF